MTKTSLETFLGTSEVPIDNRSFIKKGIHEIANFGLRTFQEDSNHKIIRELGLTIFSSLYGANVLPKQQEKIENNLRLKPGTLARYSATRGQALFLGLEYVGAFHFLGPLINALPYIGDFNHSNNIIENGYLINSAISVSINIPRYLLAKYRGKRIPSISIYASLILGLQGSAKGLEWTYKKTKDPIREKLREVKEETDWLLSQ
jgi:hypothetical protein